MLTSIAAPKLNPERGFLPLQDPLRRLPQMFDTWESVALGLPKLFASDRRMSFLTKRAPKVASLMARELGRNPNWELTPVAEFYKTTAHFNIETAVTVPA